MDVWSSECEVCKGRLTGLKLSTVLAVSLVICRGSISLAAVNT